MVEQNDNKFPFFERAQIKNFYSFRKLEINLSAPINLFIGRNDTGKTGLLKLLYSVVKTWEVYSRKEYYDNTPFKKVLGEKLFDIFQPRENRRIGDMLNKNVKEKLRVDISFAKFVEYQPRIWFEFGETTYKTINECIDTIETISRDFNTIFIPEHEVLTAFNTIKYARQRLYLPGFDDTYLDLIKNLEVPVSLKETDVHFNDIATEIEEFLGTDVMFFKGEEPFISKRANQKFAISLTADSVKKLGTIAALIKNRQIRQHSTLFFDNIENQLDPRSISHIANIVTQLANQGTQIFISSTSYFLIRALTQYAEKTGTNILCHSLSKPNNKDTELKTYNLKDGLPENPIISDAEKLFL